MRRKKRKLQKRLVIITTLSLLFVMTVGYAAFQTNLTINAKGKIIGEKGISSEDLIKTLAQNGNDGLYADATEANRYIYRGANPDNYIYIKEKINNEEVDVLYKIISVESDRTLKVIRNEALGDTKPYDSKNGRYSSTSYCHDSNYGCNVWGSSTTMLDSNLNPISKMPREYNRTATYALPDKEAEINTYLNTTFYNTLADSVKGSDTQTGIIDKHVWNVGLLVSEKDQTLATDVLQEKAYKWQGKIGLMNATEFVKTSTDASCTSAYAGLESPNPCKNTNWLFNSSITQLTLSTASTATASNVWVVYSAGQLYSGGAAVGARSIRPVFYLKSDITLLGKGTSDDTYTIIS